MSIWALFVLGLLWVKLQWMFSYRSFCRHFLLVKYLGFKLLDPLPDFFLKRLYHFTLFQTKVCVWPMMSSTSTWAYQPFAYLLWLWLLVFLLLNCRGSLYVTAAVFMFYESFLPVFGFLLIFLKMSFEEQKILIFKYNLASGFFHDYCYVLRNLCPLPSYEDILICFLLKASHFGQ